MHDPCKSSSFLCHPYDCYTHKSHFSQLEYGNHILLLEGSKIPFLTARIRQSHFLLEGSAMTIIGDEEHGFNTMTQEPRGRMFATVLHHLKNCFVYHHRTQTWHRGLFSLPVQRNGSSCKHLRQPPIERNHYIRKRATRRGHFHTTPLPLTPLLYFPTHYLNLGSSRHSQPQCITSPRLVTSGSLPYIPVIT